MVEDFDLGSIRLSSEYGMLEKQAPEAQARQKIASLDDLKGFNRVASNTLIHMSEQSLWTLDKDASGEYFIQRNFDPGNVVKG